MLLDSRFSVTAPQRCDVRTVHPSVPIPMRLLTHRSKLSNTLKTDDAIVSLFTYGFTMVSAVSGW